MKSANTALFAFSLLLAPAPAVLANGLGEDSEDHHGSHVHGTATLQVVLDNSTLEVQLSSPAVNLLGFEGPANNAEKQAAATAAREKLEQPAQLFRFEGIDCRLADRGVKLTGLPGHDDDHHEGEHHDDKHHDEDHHEDKHHDDEHHGEDHHGDEHHDDEHHGEDHHEDDHHDGDEHHDEEHSDIVATYRFQCDGSGADAVQLPLLKLFPGIEKLDTQWIVAGKQGASTLGQGDQTLRLR